jgi:hypothetical protein
VRRAVSVQIRPADLKPLFGDFEIRADLFDEHPELGTVIHLCQMRDFVRRDVIKNKRRREDEAP